MNYEKTTKNKRPSKKTYVLVTPLKERLIDPVVPLDKLDSLKTTKRTKPPKKVYTQVSPPKKRLIGPVKPLGEVTNNSKPPKEYIRVNPPKKGFAQGKNHPIEINPAYPKGQETQKMTIQFTLKGKIPTRLQKGASDLSRDSRSHSVGASTKISQI